MPSRKILVSATLSICFVALIVAAVAADKNVDQAKDSGIRLVLGAVPAADGGLYATGADGLYYVNGGHAQKVAGIDGIVLEIIPDAVSGAYAHTAGKMWRLEKAVATLITEGIAESSPAGSNPYFALWQKAVQDQKDAEAFAATR
jgi:hypothetical protein